MDKLAVMAKADRNPSGSQLLTLLSQDFSSEHGRCVLLKNAFALVRLRRYRHAAAAFLCSSPPLVKEAVNVLCMQVTPPLTTSLALLQ